MQWVEKHQYSKISKNLWTCWCAGEEENLLSFESWEELLEHLRKALTIEVVGKAVNNPDVIGRWRAAYDENEFDLTWKHNSDAAIVSFVGDLLGLSDDE